jgi:hypothetical protein
MCMIYPNLIYMCILPSDHHTWTYVCFGSGRYFMIRVDQSDLLASRHSFGLCSLLPELLYLHMIYICAVHSHADMSTIDKESENIA